MDYKAAPLVRQIRAGSRPELFQQLRKPVPVKTALNRRGGVEKFSHAAETESKSKEEAIGDFLSKL